MMSSVSSMILSARWQTQHDSAAGEAGRRGGSASTEEGRGIGICIVCAGDVSGAGDDGDNNGGVCSDANSDIGSTGMGGKRMRRCVGDVKRARADVV